MGGDIAFYLVHLGHYTLSEFSTRLQILEQIPTQNWALSTIYCCQENWRNTQGIETYDILIKSICIQWLNFSQS